MCDANTPVSHLIRLAVLTVRVSHTVFLQRLEVPFLLDSARCAFNGVTSDDEELVSTFSMRIAKYFRMEGKERRDEPKGIAMQDDNRKV